MGRIPVSSSFLFLLGMESLSQPQKNNKKPTGKGGKKEKKKKKGKDEKIHPTQEEGRMELTGIRPIPSQ